MTAIEKVGLLDSNNTLLNSDYDFSAFELRLTDNTGGVLFDDVDVKTEFDLSGTSGDVTISAGNAIIVATRATSTPIPNKKIAVRYQLSDTKTLAGIGTKIYIELDQTLIDDPTLIEDTYPSIDYAQGKNIGELKRADERPTNPHIKLWEYDGAWNDLRTYPEIDGKKIDSNVVKLTGNQTIAGIKTFTSNPVVPTATQSNEAPNLGQVESAIIEATGATDLIDGTFMLGEPCIKGDSLFKEVGPTFAEARTEQNIGDVAGNTRVSIPVIGSGVAGNNLKLALAKSDNLGEDLTLRIETDDGGKPSGELIDPNATATIARANLTTSLTDFGVLIDTPQYTEDHLQTLDNVESAIVPHKGLKFTLKKQVGLVNIVKNSSCTATKCYLYDSEYNLIETKDFIGDTATWGYGDLRDGKTYYVLAGSGTSTYNSVKQSGATSFPYSGDSLDIEGGFTRNLATDNGGIVDYSNRNLQYGTRGFKVKAKEKLYINSIRKYTKVTANTAYIRNSSGTIIASSAFSGDTATFDIGQVVFNKDEEFFIELGSQNGEYQCYYTTSRSASSLTNIEWIRASVNGAVSGGINFGQNISGISTTTIIEENNINNIENIITNENFLINEGQKGHIVLAQEGDEVDPVRYFKVGTTTNHTTTRPLNKWNSSRGTPTNTIFPYCSSSLFYSTLLSKTDATYSYKLPNDIVRFAKTDGVIGEKVKCSFKGIADLFTGLTTGRFYYAGNTNGTISINPGINTSVLGYSVSNTKLDVGYRDLIIQGTTYSVASLPTDRKTSSTTYITLKSATIRQDGIYQIDFTLIHSNSGGIVYAQVFRNGVAYGIEHSAGAGSWGYKTENLYFNANDLLEVRLRTPSNTGTIRDLTIRHGIYQKNTDTTAINTVD